MLSARDAPPVYVWDQAETLAFIAVCLFGILVTEVCLLTIFGFDDLLLIICAGYSTRHAYKACFEWNMRRRFRKELDRHG